MSMNKTNKAILWIAGIAIVSIIAVFLSRDSNDNQSIKIGVINPMTGPAGSIGEEVANSLKLASSSSVTLLFEDDQCDAKKAISAYMKLKEEGVHIFYLSCSGSVMAVAPLVKEDGNLIVTAYAGSSEIRKTGDEVIRFIPDALSIAGAMADYVLKLPATSTIGLLSEVKDYSKSVALTLTDKLGKRIAISEQYSADDTSYRTQISKLKAAHVDTLLYVPTSDKAEQLVFSEMKTLGYRPNIVGDVNTCEYPLSPKDFGIQAVCFDAGFQHETDAYKQFLASYKTSYGKDPVSPFYDSITYDIVKLIERFSKAGTHVNLVSELKSYFLAGVEGQMSNYSFSANGEVLPDQYLKMFNK